MARLLCAWSLLLLCASPFTAPFSTCDLAMLLAHRPHDIRTTEFGTSVWLLTDDALGLSPEIKRVALGKPMQSRISFGATTRMPHAPLIGHGHFAACDPWQQLSPADEYVAQPTVLRL
jgi:hypothetical protein